MKKVTYLLGAGASAKAIPTVNKFNEELRIFQEILKAEMRKDHNYGSFFQAFYKHFEEIKKHYSIDTYAKKLMLTNKKTELEELKFIIMLFLNYFQLAKNLSQQEVSPKYQEKDQRYDTFLATLLTKEEENVKLPDNLRILSWNYDFQFEIAFANYIQENKQIEELLINKIDKALQIYPAKNTPIYDNNKFSLFKLNGTSNGYINDKEFERIVDVNKNNNAMIESSERQKIEREERIQLYLKHIQYFEKFISNHEQQAILFAWDKTDLTINVRNKAKEATADTEILVVIGYSFPNFNRKIDQELIENMQNIQEIYLQYPDIDNCKEVEEKIKTMLAKQDIKIFHKISTDEFFIPTVLL